MPSVAVGVVIFMSPVLATAAATKATVPLPTSNTPAFCLPPSPYTKVSMVISALALALALAIKPMVVAVVPAVGLALLPVAHRFAVDLEHVSELNPGLLVRADQQQV